VAYLTTITGYIGLCIANCVFALLVFVFAVFERRGTLWWPMARMWGKTIYAGAFSTISTQGFEGLKWGQPAILMANHESYLDVPALIASCPIPLRFVARREVFKVPIMGQAMWMTGQISIDRSDREKSIQSLKAAASRIANGCTVIMFPEGTRSADGELREFKKGGFMLAIEAGVPIIPVGLSGTRDVVPRGSSQFHSASVGVCVGPAIETRDLTVEDRDALMERVRAGILVAREEASLLPR
jgi:1-acyl-sn-glycerol-3-phosphate acyltransferase